MKGGGGAGCRRDGEAAGSMRKAEELLRRGHRRLVVRGEVYGGGLRWRASSGVISGRAQLEAEPVVAEGPGLQLHKGLGAP